MSEASIIIAEYDRQVTQMKAELAEARAMVRVKTKLITSLTKYAKKYEATSAELAEALRDIVSLSDGLIPSGLMMRAVAKLALAKYDKEKK